MQEGTLGKVADAGLAVMGIDATLWAVFLTIALTEHSVQLWSWPTWAAIAVLAVAAAVTAWAWIKKPKPKPRVKPETAETAETIVHGTANAETVKGLNTGVQITKDKPGTYIGKATAKDVEDGGSNIGVQA